MSELLNAGPLAIAMPLLRLMDGRRLLGLLLVAVKPTHKIPAVACCVTTLLSPLRHSTVDVSCASEALPTATPTIASARRTAADRSRKAEEPKAAIGNETCEACRDRVAWE